MDASQPQREHWIDVSVAARIAGRSTTTIVRWWKVEGIIRGRQPRVHAKIQIERGSLMQMLEEAEGVE